MPLAWISENVRLSLFSPEAIRLSSDNWKLLTDQDEAAQEQKGGGRHVFAGPLIGGQFSLGALANRCDIILAPANAADQLRDDIVPSVGQWPTALEEFQIRTEAFLE